MNSKLGIFAIVFTVATLSGCASMSSDECLTSDWQTIGYEDGARGYTAERIGQHRKACAKHGVAPDFAAYQSGRDQGLVEFCQPSRGFNVGASGGNYNGVCNVTLEADFLDAYNAGRLLHTLRSNVNRASSAISGKEYEIDRIKKKIDDKEAALIGEDTATADRVLLLADLKELHERTGELEAQIKDLYAERARSQVELEHYQITVADMGY
jgi:hypothetical protein